MNDSRRLMDIINQASFAVDDTKLFLDTHPCDEEALAYFKEYSKVREHAMKEYARLYGPLTMDTASESCTNQWKWVKQPWPWQIGGC